MLAKVVELALEDNKLNGAYMKETSRQAGLQQDMVESSGQMEILIQECLKKENLMVKEHILSPMEPLNLEIGHKVIINLTNVTGNVMLTDIKISLQQQHNLIMNHKEKQMAKTVNAVLKKNLTN